jgi:hypothetical protein
MLSLTKDNNQLHTLGSPAINSVIRPNNKLYASVRCPCTELISVSLYGEVKVQIHAILASTLEGGV